jgi:hypothetical protein
MAIQLLVRAVSDRFGAAAKANPDLADTLLDQGLPPPEWNVNAVRDHQRRHTGLAKAGISLDADAAEVHDLGNFWVPLPNMLEALGANGANIFRVGAVVGDDEAGIRVLTSDEARQALTTLEGLTPSPLDNRIREVLRAGGQRMNPFTRRMENVYGGGSEDQLVSYVTTTLARLRDILQDARQRTFGLAVQVVP